MESVIQLNIKRLLQIALLLLPGPFLAIETPSSAEAAEEAELVMSAFVFNFARYVDWPREISGERLHICTVGEGPLIDRLADLTGQQLSNKEVHVMPQSEEDLEAGSCSMTIFGLSERERVREFLQDRRILQTLTISQIDRFAEMGGVIGLFTDGKKVRFAINTGVAEAAGLQISSRLLKLARIVSTEAE